MASCVRNIYTKNYQNLITGSQVTIENVKDVFWDTVYVCKPKSPISNRRQICKWVNL